MPLWPTPRLVWEVPWVLGLSFLAGPSEYPLDLPKYYFQTSPSAFSMVVPKLFMETPIPIPINSPPAGTNNQNLQEDTSNQ